MVDFSQGKKISIEEAREACKVEGVLVLWRPEPELEEAHQYAVVFV